MTDLGGLKGNQQPTFMWVPDFEQSFGDEAIALYEQCAAPMNQRLDFWQKLSLRVAFALNPKATLLCFEVAIIVSRQNGKGEVLLAMELAWLFLFGEKLIIHSAHLFETSREHFLKAQALIENNPTYLKRVSKIKEGRGSEEIILKSGARLKFMSRKGGAGRGFTGGKIVFDEAMYLDASMMAAGLPTMATRGDDAQVVYTGSAGMRHSTQLAEVRKRGLARNDPGLALLMWEASKPVYDEHGRLVAGDDPSDPRVHARCNPAYGTGPGARISPDYVAKEARALGGYGAPEFWMERLGIGDYPIDGEQWAVIEKKTWESAVELDSQISGNVVLALDGDRGVTSLAVCGKRADGRRHGEVIARHRGSSWVIDKLMGDGEEVHEVYGALGLWKRLGKPPVIALKTGEVAETALKLAGPPDRPTGVRVEFLTELDYAAACAATVEDLRVGDLVHIAQDSLTSAVAAAQKRENAEGGWRWDRDVPVHQSPLVAMTLANWGFVKFGAKRVASKVW